MILNWIKRKPKRAPLDELREQVAALKQELAAEHHCRTAYDQAASKRLAALEKDMPDVKDGVEALTKLTSLDKNERTKGWFHMMRRSVRADD